ncbi:MAG: LysM domain-containing protein, partial [Chloroflexota bacterium]
ALLNKIAYPYIIYPGQVLALPEADEEDPVEIVSPPPPLYAPNLHTLLLPLVAKMAPLSRHAVSSKPPEAPASEPDTYVVQRGDFLIALAERFDIGWRELAELNDIRYPFVIHPGQVLELP